MGAIEEARRRAEERKTAAGVTVGLDEAEARETVRRLYSGFDLDLDELMETIEDVRRTSYLVVLAGIGGPGAMAAATFGEGLLVGLLTAEALLKSEGGG